MKYALVVIVSVVGYAMIPVTVSAESLSCSRTAPEVFQYWFEQNPSLNVAESLFRERFGVAPDTSYYGDTVRDHTPTNERSDSSNFSDEPSRDTGGVSPGFSDSVNGYPSGSSSGVGERSSSESGADPLINDLSRRDGISGFGSPGSIGR